MSENAPFLLPLARENGFGEEGLRLLLAVIHGLSMRRSLAGDGPHLGSEQVAMGFFATTQERFGVLTRDVLEHWGLESPSSLGKAVALLVEAGFLSRSSDELDDYDQLPPPPEDWPEPPAPPSVRESSAWSGG